MDYSKSKFENRAVEVLYEIDPDESIGSVDELGWAGLYRQELSIIFEDAQGFVWIDEFTSQEELDEDWKRIEDTYEEYDLGLLV